MADRHWNPVLQEWVYDDDIYQALDAAQLAILQYHNDDREAAETWLIRAYRANRQQKEGGR